MCTRVNSPRPRNEKSRGNRLIHVFFIWKMTVYAFVCVCVCTCVHACVFPERSDEVRAVSSHPHNHSTTPRSSG